MKRLFLSLMTVISFVIQPAVSYAATMQGMSNPYSASTIYNLARGGNTYKLSTLSKRDMDVTNRYGDTALCIAVRNHDEEAYNNLLDAGVNPNPRCMESLEFMRPKSSWATLLTPKAGYVIAALAVGGGIAMASGGGGGGGGSKCSGYTQQDCEAGYYISGTCEEDISYHKCSKNTKNTPENCAAFVVNKDECRVCQVAYYLDGSDCLPRTVIDNCTGFIADEDACTSCEDSYYLDNGVCKKGTIDHCETYSSANICSQCESGYVASVNEDACVLPIEHCTSYAANGACLSCDGVYRPSTDQSACVLNIAHCSVINNDGTCQVCEENYSTTEDRMKCVPTIEHCKIHNADGSTCTQCDDSYATSEDKTKCLPQIEGCSKYDNTGNCAECLSTYPILDGGKCYNDDTFCTQVRNKGTPSCNQPMVKDFCPLPNGSYNTNYWTCKAGPANCSSADQDTGKCITCSTGYYVDANGECQRQSIENCKQYVNNENKCSQCDTLYYPDNGGAVCKQIDAYNLCEQSEGVENACSRCYSTYSPQGSLCVIIPNCVESSGSNEYCTKCTSKYYPENGVCTLISKCDESDGINKTCTRCVSSYYPEEGVCTPVPNCASSEGYRNECTTCSANFFLYADRKCYDEQTYCSYNGYNQSSACQSWQTTTFCPLPGVGESSTYRKCQNGNIPNCKDHNEDGSCNTCNDLYYVTNGGASCTQIDSGNCSHSDGVHNACLTCDTGFYPNESGICTVQNVPNCRVHVANENKCDTCNNKYYPTNDGATCSEITSFENCDHSGGKIDQCQQCLSKYYVDGNQCTLIENCSASGGIDKTCTQCNSPYYINSSGTCSLIENCAVSGGVDNVCTQCNSTYYPNGSGVCTQIQNCEASLGYRNECTTCSDSFYLYTDKQCYNEQTYCSYYGYTQTSACEDWQTTTWCPLPGAGESSTYRTCSNETIPNCHDYNEDGSCKTCNNLYYITDGGATCTQIDSGNCSHSDGVHNVCETCNTDYYPNGSGICTVQNVPNCSVYVANENKCDTCNSKYYPTNDNTVCSEITSFENCDHSGGKVDVCQQCNSKYYIDGNQCTLINNCRASEGTYNVCTQCNSAYYINEGGTCSEVPNCETSYGYENKCVTCKSTHPQLGANGTCYTEQEYCTGYLATNYTNTAGCTVSRQYPEFCPLATGGVSSTYRVCHDGTKYQCTAYSQDGRTDYCLECAKGYYVSDGSCHDQPAMFGCKTYLTDASGCAECYEGFDLSDGTCTRNASYVAGDKYEYQVSNAPEGYTSYERDTALIKTHYYSAGGQDVYSDATIIGFTSTMGIARNGEHSSHPEFGNNFAEYDVFNTSYSDNSGVDQSASITLDGANIIGDSGEKLNESTSDAGYLIGLSSAFAEDSQSSQGGNWVGNSSVYNAIAWGETGHTQTGSITINYEPIHEDAEFAVYGIYGYNNAYNAYSTYSAAIAKGIIVLNIDNHRTNYGIYARNNAYNAYGSGAVGYINLYGLSDNPKLYGVYALNGSAVNAAAGANAEILQMNWEYQEQSTANTVTGVYAHNGDAYNAMGDNKDFVNSSSLIRLLSYNGLGVSSRNGTAYNAYYGNGVIELPYGGTALKGVTAYNAKGNYEVGASGTITFGSSDYQASADYIKICAAGTNCYNASGDNALGTINIYGTPYPISNLINSDENGNGVINVYSETPVSNVKEMTVLGSGSVNGTRGSINVYLGSGWNLNNNVNAVKVVAISGMDLGEEGTVKIVKNTNNNVYVNTVIGLENGNGGGEYSSITIGGTTRSNEFIRANRIYGISGLTANLTNAMNIEITAGLSNQTSVNGYAVGVQSSGNTLTSNATIDMDIYGSNTSSTGRENSAYGLRGVNNSGNIYLDTYSDVDLAVGMQGSAGGTMVNSGNININPHYAGNIVIGMDAYSDTSVDLSGNIDVTTAIGGDATYGIRHILGAGAERNASISAGSGSKITVNDSLSNSGNSYGVYIDSSDNTYGKSVHATLSGTIEMKNGRNMTGVYVKGAASNATVSVGSVNMTVNNSSSSIGVTAGRIIGMHAVDGANVSTDSTISITSNVWASEFIAGMYAEGVAPGTSNPSVATNAGTIIIDCSSAPDEEGILYGMMANGGSITNSGTGNIIIRYNESNTSTVVYGMRAINGGHLTNTGTIEINNSSFQSEVTDSTNSVSGDAYYTSYEPDVTLNSTSFISVDETSTIENSGTVESQAPLKLLGSGRMMMKRGANIIAPSVSGTLTLDTDIVAEGNEDTYVTTNLVTGNTDDLTVESGSAMFTASTAVNEDDENSVDGVMTRKPFDTLVKSVKLANYLEDNYTGNNAEEFFATLKTASNATEFNRVLSKELGLCLMPNFAQENFNVFRSLGNLITDNLFSKEMTNERMMVGYDYLALLRDTHKGITGYENTSNSSYFIGDKALNNRSRFGLGVSITKFNSDYDDDSDRDEMFAQLLASYMYDFGNKWRYAGVLHSGYGWGEYTRKLNQGDVDGNLHDFTYGLQNEFRYGIETPYAVIEPQLEMNFTGYYQRRINEDNENGSIMMKGTNNFSAESGIGLYASKEFDLDKYGKFKGRVGGSYYHEWAHPYHSIKARMRGTDGWYKIESDGIFQRDRFMISADVTYTYRMFDMYLRGSQYFEKDSVAVLNAGIKYNF